MLIEDSLFGTITTALFVMKYYVNPHIHRNCDCKTSAGILEIDSDGETGFTHFVSVVLSYFKKVVDDLSAHCWTSLLVVVHRFPVWSAIICCVLFPSSEYCIKHHVSMPAAVFLEYTADFANTTP